MSDNKIIRTTVLDIITYLPSDGKFVILTANGTCKVSWQTLVSTLTASIPP